MNLSSFTDVPWAPRPNRLAVHAGRPVDNLPITAAHVIVTSRAGVLLTKVRSRGWDIPGGHIEPGESAAEAAIREVEEETGLVVTTLRTVGYLGLTLLGDKPQDYPYPYPQAAQLVFTASSSAAPVRGGAECSEARWVPPAEASVLCASACWLPLLALVA